MLGPHRFHKGCMGYRGLGLGVWGLGVKGFGLGVLGGFMAAGLGV